MSSLKDIDPQTETELQAAAFRALREHLQSRADVQNRYDESGWILQELSVQMGSGSRRLTRA